MPSLGSRGTLPGRLRMADDMLQARLATLRDHLDDASDTGGRPPLGGGVLTRTDFRELVANNPDFQQRLAARMLFATEGEKAALRRELQRMVATMTPPEVQAAAPPPVGPTGAPPTQPTVPSAAPPTSMTPAPTMPPGGVV